MKYGNGKYDVTAALRRAIAKGWVYVLNEEIVIKPECSMTCLVGYLVLYLVAIGTVVTHARSHARSHARTQASLRCARKVAVQNVVCVLPNK